ncbi:MAG TPA: hypothetical protein VIQ30_01845, partial [Pseudonocardia sp.]
VPVEETVQAEPVTPAVPVAQAVPITGAVSAQPGSSLDGAGDRSPVSGPVARSVNGSAVSGRIPVGTANTELMDDEEIDLLDDLDDLDTGEGR